MRNTNNSHRKSKIKETNLLGLIKLVCDKGDNDCDDENDGKPSKMSVNKPNMKRLRGTRALLLNTSFDMVSSFLNTGYRISSLKYKHVQSR